MKNISKILIVLFLTFYLFNCASAQKKESSTAKLISGNKEMEEFFNKEALPDEAVRVYVSSNDYIIDQVGQEDVFKLIDDKSGRDAMSGEIHQYDMVNMYTEAIYRVEVYKDSGLIAHIRPVRPSRVSEINKIIIDDITRLKFKIEKKDDEKQNTNSSQKEDGYISFTIRYAVKLQKMKSKEEIRQILEENAR